MATCRGSLRALLLYDIAEEFDLDKLRNLIGSQPPAWSPGFTGARVCALRGAARG